MAVTSGNPKHVFDFEGILNMDIDPAHWKNVKKQIEDAFGNLKIAIQDGLAEEEAQKYIDQFNKIFRKAKLPEIGLDDLREDFAKLEVNVEKAVAAINNIELDRLDDMLHELKLINGEVEKISKNKGGIKLFDDDTINGIKFISETIKKLTQDKDGIDLFNGESIKKVMDSIERMSQAIAKTTNPLVRSINQIDQAIGRATLSASDIQEALEFTGRGKGKKGELDVSTYYDEYQRVRADKNSSWEEQYYWLVKFNKAYESFMAKQKDPNALAQKYSKLYNQARGGDVDRRNMLQNIINRGQGKDLVGYAQEPWALESTLKEIKGILQAGINVNIGDAKLNVNIENDNNENQHQQSPSPQNGFEGAADWAKESTVKDIDKTLKKLYDATSKGVYENIDEIVAAYANTLKARAVDIAKDGKILEDVRELFFKKFMDSFPTKDIDTPDRHDEIKTAFKNFADHKFDANVLKSLLYNTINKSIDKVLIDFSEDATTQLQDVVDRVKQTHDDKKDTPKEKTKKSKDTAVVIDSAVVSEALSKMQVTADNKDVVAELKNAENSLGKLVAQEETMIAIRDALEGDSGKERRKELAQGFVTPSDNDYYDTENLESILSDNKKVIEQLMQENLLTESMRVSYDAINKSIEERITLQKATSEAEYAAEDTFVELDKLYDKIGETDDPDEVNALLEERKRLLSEISPLALDTYEQSIEEETKNNELIAKRVALLRDAKNGLVAIEDIDDIIKETDTLESKLERLKDVADTWGFKIKDDDIDEVAQELEDFEKTYDRIVLKLHNGRNIEILPNAKGMRALHKYDDEGNDDEYGESEIVDVIFERVKKAIENVNIDDVNPEESDSSINALLKNIGVSLGTLVAQDDTLQSLKESLSNITVTPDNGEIVSELKTLVQNLGNLAQDQTLQSLKNDGARLTKEDIATAIRNGVATQEILGKYRPASFLDIFDYDTSDDTLDHVISALTGEILSEVDARKKFNEDIKGNYFVPRDMSAWDLSPSDIITTEDALKNVLIDKSEKTENWAKVIVEAINTQGGQIIETIKLVLPQEITGGIDDTQLVNAFNVLTKAINDFGYGAKSFFSDILGGNVPKETDVRGALEALGLISSSGKPTFKMPGIGGMNKGIAISDDVVYHTTRDSEIGNVYELMKKQNAAYEMGASVARIIAAHEGNGYAMSLQSRAPGKNFRDDAAATGVLEATDEQIDRLLYTFEVLEKNGLVIEFGGDNILFDKDKGFSLVDMTSDKIPGHWDDQVTAKDMLSSLLMSFRNIDTNTPEERNKLYALQDRIQQRSYLSTEERLVNADTIAAEKARARAEANKSKSKEITVATDNSDVVEAINKLGNSLGAAVAQDDTLQSIRDNAVQLTKEDIVGAIKEGVPAPPEETPDSDAPWALESTLNTTIKNILEKIQANTAKLDGVEIRQAVDDNTQATKQAASAVSDQVDDAATPADVDKIIRKQKVDKDGNPTGPIAQTQIHTEKTDSAVRTVKDTFLIDGEETQHIFREVIDDLEKLRKANKKDAADVARAQKKVDEFVAKFESKTGGNARFVEGFEDIKGFTVDKTNIDEAYNKMIELQRKYAELETNFRKGQSSLNPFVNAINKAQNIGNIFGAVEIKFNGLVDKSEELTSQFAKLKDLSESIKQFTDRMVSDPDSITPADFTEFSKQMGEFTATKTQVDGMIKNESKLNKTVAKEQNDRIKEWLDLSKKLGTVQAKINSGIFDETVVEQAKKEAEILQRKIDEILPFINDPVQHLVPIGDANIASEDKAVKAEMSKRIGILVGQYEKLGQLQARAEKAGAIVEREKYDQLKGEVEAETQTLRLNEQQNAGLLRALQLHQETAYANEKDLTVAKERQRLFNEWIELVKQISALDAQIESGLFDEVAVNNAKMARDGLSKHIDAILPQLDLSRDEYIFAGQESMKSEQSTITAQRQKLFKELAGNYAKLGEAQAQVDIKQTDAAKERVAQLSREIASKKAILNLSQDELEILEAISNQSRAENSNMLSAKDRDKAARAELQAQKKLSRRQALVGKAGSAIGRADSVWLETTTLDPNALPKEFLDRVKEYEKKLDALKIKHNELSTSQGPVTKQQKNQLIAQTNAVNELTNELGSLVDEYQRLSGANAQELGITDLNGKSSLEDYKKQLTSAVVAATHGKAQIKGFNWETKTLTYTVKTGAHEFTEYTAAVRGLDHQMVSLRGSSKRTETFLEATKRKMGEISSYMSGMALFSRASQEIRKGVQYVREIDLALTELKKVTNETDATYDKFLKTAAKTGAKLGSTISAVTEATATFAKLGYEMDMASEMAEAAIVYKNVGDNIASTEDAADSIISTMKGFRLEASESMAIVDRFNEVGEENCPSYIVIYG